MAEYDGDFSDLEGFPEWYAVSIRDKHTGLVRSYKYAERLTLDLFDTWVLNEWACDCYRGQVYFDNDYLIKGDSITEIPCNKGCSDRRFQIVRIELPNGDYISQRNQLDLEPAEECVNYELNNEERFLQRLRDEQEDAKELAAMKGNYHRDYTEEDYDVETHPGIRTIGPEDEDEDDEQMEETP